MKPLLCLGFLLLSILSYGQTEPDTIVHKSDAVVPVEILPVYPGGEQAMMTFISKNIKYPKKARRKGIQGRVILKFVVSSTGDIKDVIAVNKVKLGYGLEEEAIRVIYMMPKWTPGYQNGKPVSVMFTVPINFKLE